MVFFLSKEMSSIMMERIDRHNDDKAYIGATDIVKNNLDHNDVIMMGTLYLD